MLNCFFTSIAYIGYIDNALETNAMTFALSTVAAFSVLIHVGPLFIAVPLAVMIGALVHVHTQE